MPHISLDYSANLESTVDVAGLCSALRIAAVETGVFPVAGIRVRAFCADHVSIADGDCAHGYIDISVRLRGGRDLATRKAATAKLFAAAQEFLKDVMDTQPIAVSLEMRDIDPDLSPKLNTIRPFLEAKAQQG